MAFTIGTEVFPTDGTHIASVIPIEYTGNRSLLPGIDRITHLDCTSASVTATLPDAVSSNGIRFLIKNTGLSAINVARLAPLGSDTIEGVPAARPCILSNGTEYVEVYSDGTTSWKKSVQRTFTFASIQANASTSNIGTTFAKFDGWDQNTLSTSEKCVVDLTNNRIDILDFQGPVQDGYQIDAALSFEYNNNNTVTAQIFADGVLKGIPLSINAGGAGKPVSITIPDAFSITNPTTCELHIKAEAGGSSTLTVVQAKMIISRIGG